MFAVLAAIIFASIALANPVTRRGTLWLGMFATLHSAYAFVGAANSAAGSPGNWWGVALLAGGFVSLLEYARRWLSSLSTANIAPSYRRYSKALVVVLAASTGAVAIGTSSAAITGAAVGVLLALPAAAMMGFAYWWGNRAPTTDARVRIATALTVWSLIGFAIVAGTVAPGHPSLPVWFVTEESFARFFGIPAAVLCIVCTTGVVVGLAWQLLWLGRAARDAERSSARLTAARLTAVLDSMGEGVLVLDQDLRCQMINRSGARLVRSTPAELLGRRLRDVFPAADTSPFAEAYRRVIASKTAESIEALSSVIGTWFEARVSPVATGVVVTFRDVTEVRQRHDAIRVSEERYHEATDAFGVGVFDRNVTDASNYWSPSTLRLFGWDADAPITRDGLVEAVIPADRARLADAWAQSQNPDGGGRFDVELRVRRRDSGDVRWLLVRGRTHFEGSRPTRIIGAVMDISARKEAEAISEMSERRLRAATRTFAIGIAEYTYDSDVLYCSPEYLDLCGLDRDTPIREPLPFGCLLLEDMPRLVEARRQALESPAGRFSVDVRRRIPESGEVRWTRLQGHVEYAGVGAPHRPVRTITIAVDVTDEKHVEKALRDGEARLHRAEAIARTGNWKLDHLTNRLDWSPEVFCIFEREAQRFPASCEAFIAAVYPDDRERVAAAYTQSLSDRKPYTIVHRVQMPDGRIKYVEERCETEFADNGTPLVSVGTVQDVTEHVLTDAALRASLLEKATLLREVHHRVKNNLQVINSLLYFHAKRVDDTVGRAAFVDASARLQAMTLVHERLYESEDLSEVEMSEYLNTLARELHRSFHPATDHITVSVAAESLRCPIDVALPLGMLVSELMSNAFKHAFPDGRAGRIEIGLTSDTRAMQLWVADTGVGTALVGGTPPTSSFGWQLIGKLTMQTGASVAVSVNGGTRVTIALPHRTEDVR